MENQAAPAGYLRRVTYVLNGQPVTADRMTAEFAGLADPCRCAPGLGYVCGACGG